MPHGFARLIDRLADAWKRRAVALKAVSFAVIGVANSLVDLSVFLLAYGVFAVPLVPANVLAWFIAVSGSYAMNSFITFSTESGGRLRWRDYGTFVVSGIAGVIANTATLVAASYFMPIIAAKLIAILASFVVNFSLSHFVVFRPRKRPARDVS